MKLKPGSKNSVLVAYLGGRDPFYLNHHLLPESTKAGIGSGTEIQNIGTPVWDTYSPKQHHEPLAKYPLCVFFLPIFLVIYMLTF